MEKLNELKNNQKTTEFFYANFDFATSALYSLNYNFLECRIGKATTTFQTTTSRKSIQKCKIQQRNRGLNKPMAICLRVPWNTNGNAPVHMSNAQLRVVCF